MKLKLDEKGNVVVQDGKPVYVSEDGKTEVPYDAPAMHSRIVAMGEEAKKHREAKEAAEGKLKAFEGIADPAAALKALETVKNLDEKKLVDAGEVAKIKAEAVKAYEEKIVDLNKSHANALNKITGERDALRAGWDQEKVFSAFTGSKFVNEKMSIPADMVVSHFGARFKIEDGKIVGYHPTGDKVFSRSKPGDPAEFEEALELLVDAYPNKEHILKGSGQSGGGIKQPKEGKADAGFRGKGDMGGDKAARVAAINARFGNSLKNLG